MPPPMSRPGGPQTMSIEDMTKEEARVALAQLRTEYATDADFETLLKARLKAMEEGARSQRDRAAAAIAELEDKVGKKG